MPANQLFTDWVTGDLITAAKLNQMKNDLLALTGGTVTGLLTLDGTAGFEEKHPVWNAGDMFTQRPVGQADAGEALVWEWTDASAGTKTVVMRLYADGTLNVNGRIVAQTYLGMVRADGTADSLPAGWTSTKNLVGQYTITHNLNKAFGSQYAISVIPISPVKPGTYNGLFSQTNSIDIEFTNDAGTRTDTAFTFILVAQ